MEEKSTKTEGPDTGQQIQTVLVVDDDDNWCFISERLLKKTGVGKEIITANNGQVAFEKLQAMAASGEDMPDLILLDIKMPVMDGFGFLDELTKSKDLDISRTRIFICSSSFLPKDKERATHYPVVEGFIIKPLTQEDLKAIVKSA